MASPPLGMKLFVLPSIKKINKNRSRKSALQIIITTYREATDSRSLVWGRISTSGPEALDNRCCRRLGPSVRGLWCQQGLVRKKGAKPGTGGSLLFQPQMPAVGILKSRAERNIGGENRKEPGHHPPPHTHTAPPTSLLKPRSLICGRNHATIAAPACGWEHTPPDKDEVGGGFPGCLLGRVEHWPPDLYLIDQPAWGVVVVVVVVVLGGGGGSFPPERLVLYFIAQSKTSISYSCWESGGPEWRWHPQNNRRNMEIFVDSPSAETTWNKWFESLHIKDQQRAARLEALH